MVKRGRPFTYLSDLLYYKNTVLQELAKPVHLVDALIPFDEDLAAFTATKAVPALDISNYNNTVIQESQQPALLGADHPAVAEATPQPASELSYYDNTVIQEKDATRKTGRPAAMREPIIALLRSHPEGLTAEQIRGLLNAQKPIGDTLQGMRRGNLVRTEGSGREMRYFLSR